METTPAVPDPTGGELGNHVTTSFHYRLRCPDADITARYSIISIANHGQNEDGSLLNVVPELE